MKKVYQYTSLRHDFNNVTRAWELNRRNKSKWLTKPQTALGVQLLSIAKGRWVGVLEFMELEKQYRSRTGTLDEIDGLAKRELPVIADLDALVEMGLALKREAR
jgi:hypothetical protein